jgi:hypothetical protein
MKKWFPIKWFIPGFIILVVVVLYIYNRPVKKNTVLMSTPIIFRENKLEPFSTLPGDVSPPIFDVYYATDRGPVEMSPFHPTFYGNERSRSLSLGIANVRLGTGDMNWPEIHAARYRDGFENVADTITIYTNANDTALKWALRFFGWPRLGAPGELGLTPGDLQHLKEFGNTTLIDVAAAEDVASGNGHGYFVKSPWVSTDLLLTLKHGFGPQKRGLRYNEVDAAWVFPESYSQKIRQVVGQIH